MESACHKVGLPSLPVGRESVPGQEEHGLKAEGEGGRAAKLRAELVGARVVVTRVEVGGSERGRNVNGV